jgi:hypothetical protein
MRARAIAAGINEATVHAAFDDVHYLPRSSSAIARSPSSRARRGTTLTWR